MFLYLHKNDLNKTSAILRISGPDANTYLQGQFTQDLHAPAGAVAYGLWLNQKGRVLADSHVMKLAENEFLVACFSAPVTVLRERLASHIIADDVTLADETLEWERLGFWGADAEVSRALGVERPPADRFGRQGSGALLFAGRLAGEENFELLVPSAGVADVRAALEAAGARRANDEVAARERILAGIPTIPMDIGPGDLPNEGRLDEVAISYAKGCFLGQEAVARLKNLGQVRRALHVVRGAGAPPGPRTPLFQADRQIGELRSAAPDGTGFVAMAMLSLVNYRAAQGLGLAANVAPCIEVLRRV